MVENNSMKVDVAANRRQATWSRKIMFMRVLWALTRPVFALTPRPLWEIRNSLLRLYGARIGRNVHIFPTVRISMPWNLVIEDDSAVGDRVILYAVGPIFIGARATISQGAHLCAASHDIKKASRPVITLPITIKNDAWICADAFVAPGIIIGSGSIAGARAVVVKNVEDYAIVGGNPAKLIRFRDI